MCFSKIVPFPYQKKTLILRPIKNGSFLSRFLALFLSRIASSEKSIKCGKEAAESGRPM